MAVEEIRSLDDPRLEVYRQTRHTNLTRFSGRFIAEGRLVVERLVTSSYGIESVLLDERFVAAMQGIIPDEVPVYRVPHELVDQIVGFHFHRGVMACGVRRPFATLESAADA